MILGSLTDTQVRAIEDAGFSLQSCRNVYDVATSLAREGATALCLAPSALGPQVGRLAMILKRLRPDLALWLAPDARGQRADLALGLGFVRWEAANAVPASPKDAPGGPRHSPASPTQALPRPATPSERVGPIREAASLDAEPPIVVRMPARQPTRADLATQAKADNAKADHAGGSGIEADIAARYDAVTGDPLLSDEELKALLDDPQEGPSPEDPPHR